MSLLFFESCCFVVLFVCFVVVVVFVLLLFIFFKFVCLLCVFCQPLSHTGFFPVYLSAAVGL